MDPRVEFVQGVFFNFIEFMTKPQLRNLQQTVANTSLIIKKFWVDIFIRQGYINQVYKTAVSESVSELVSELVTRVNNDRTRVR